MWTQDVNKALESVAAGEKNAMRELRRKQVNIPRVIFAKILLL
jgi:hypothetical protein